MIIESFIGNIFNTNTYLLHERNKRSFICIDPSYGTSTQILQTLKEKKGELVFIINTHAHFDHVAEDMLLKEQTGARILMGKKDNETLKTQNELLEKVIRMLHHSKETDQLKKLEQFDPDRWLVDGDTVAVDDLSFTVMEMPGHSEGSIALYCEKEKLIFTGDTLFAGTHGRTDLPQSDEEKIMESLKKLAQLPADTVVYPGHERTTTIAEEKAWIERL
jgi:glyoxylase-like metal-dependent hydrolase (beta-lactamase superfamily II)